MDSTGVLQEDRQEPKRRWVASHRGTLLLLVVVVLIAGSVLVPRLVYRYSPEGRLLSSVPEGIRETCMAGFTDFLNPGFHYEATDGYPEAIAGLFCSWRPNRNPVGEITMTYLLFSDRQSLLDSYPSISRTPPSDCFTDEAGQRICIDRSTFRIHSELRPYSDHIVWTDGSLVVVDPTVADAFYR
jgi:hypothetical protein